MNVDDLRNMLASLPGDMEVRIPLYAYKGLASSFYSPCILESGPSLNSGDKLSFSLLLLPHGFRDESGPDPDLN